MTRDVCVEAALKCVVCEFVMCGVGAARAAIRWPKLRKHELYPGYRGDKVTSDHDPAKLLYSPIVLSLPGGVPDVVPDVVSVVSTYSISSINTSNV